MKTAPPSSIAQLSADDQFDSTFPRTFFSALLICCLAAIPAQAQNIWTGSAGDTNWSTAGNWSFGVAPTSGDMVQFDNVVAAFPAATVDNILDTDFTILSLIYGTVSTNGFHTILVPAGRALNINGAGGPAISVGSGVSQAAGQDSYSRFVGGGTLTVTNPTGTINIMQWGSDSDHRATLDLSGLTNLTVDVAQVRIAVTETAGEQFMMAAWLLAETNFIHTTAAASQPGILIGSMDNGSIGRRGTQQLLLGRDNRIHSDAIAAGGFKMNGAIQTRPGITNGVAVFRGAAGGADPVKILAIGDHRAGPLDFSENGTSAAVAGTFDTTGLNLDLLATDIFVARSQTNNSGLTTGVLTFDKGTIVADNVFAAYHPSPAASGSYNATATVNVNGSATMTVNNDLVLARKVGTAVPVATVNISTNATLDVKGNVVTGGGNSTLNLNGGTLNLQPAADATPGNATISTLSGNGSIANSASITNLVAITPGDPGTAGTLSIGGNLTLSNTATLNVNLAATTTVGGGINDLVSVTGNLALNSNVVNFVPLGTSLAAGSYRLVDYTGARSGFLNFTNPTRYNLGLSYATANQIHLVNSGGAPSSLTWRGSTNGNWSLTNTNWNNNADRFFQLDAVTFNNTGVGTNVALVGTLFPSSVTVNSTTNYYFTGSGKISGAAGLTKSGNGILRVNTANDFTGPVVVSGGILQMGSGTALGATNSGTTVTSGGTLDVAGVSFFNPGELVTIAGTGLNNTGAVINTGAAQQNAIRYLTLSDHATARTDNRFDVRGPGGSSSFSGAVNLGGFTLTKLGAAQMSIVDSVATNAGSIVIAGGSLSLTRSFIEGAGTINILSNALFIENFTTGSITKPLISSGGILRVTGGALTLGVPITNLAGLTVDNGIVGGDPLSLTLTNGIVGAGALVKSNTGTLVLNAANTYAGATTITAGGIKLGPNGSLPNTPGIALFSGTTFDASSVPGGLVLAGGQTLSGSGAVLGNVLSGLGTGVVPGTSAGTLTFSNNLTLNSSATTFELASDPAQVGNGINDLFLVNGDLTLGGVNNIKIVPLATLSNAPAYTLIQYLGALSGGAANLNVSSDSRYSFTVVDPTTTPGSIQVSVSGSGAAADLVWKGGAPANPRAWDTKATSNWLNTGTTLSDVFFLGDNVTFDDSANTNQVTLMGTVQPAAVVMNNNALNYTFAGSGSLVAGSFSNAGPGTLTLANTGANAVAAAATISGGTVTLANAGGNTFASGLAVNGGTLNIINSAGNTFTQPLSNNAGSVIFNQPVDITLSDRIADDGGGLGTVTKQGGSTLTLSGDNTNYNGQIVVSAGTLKAGRPSALGSALNGTTVASGATLDINGQSLFNPGDVITIAGTGVGGAGAIINSGAAQNNALRAITLSANAAIGSAINRWDVRGPGGLGSFSGALSLGGFTLTKLGLGRVSVVDANMTDPGAIEVAGGTLAFTRTHVDGAGYINIGPNSLILENYSVAANFTKPLIFNGGSVQLIGDSFPISSPITNAAGGLTANIDANITLTAQGTISGTGSLTKTGAGTLAVTAPDSSWGGTTLISAGTLQIGSGAADGSIPDLPITDNGSLFFNSANSFTLTNEISGTGSLTKRQDGMLTLSASNSFTGNITTGVGTAPQQSGGVLRILNNYALGSTPKTVTLVRAELQLEGSLTISTGITFRTSTADLTFAGAGLAAMRNVSGNNVIQGAIILTSGGGSSEYRVDAGQLSLNGVITPDTTARTLILSGTSPGFLNGPLNNSTNAFVPALEKRDAGIWTLSASNTYSGSTTIKGGTLTLAATGSISNSPVVDVQSGATLNVAAVSGGFVLGTNQTLMGSGSVVGNVLAAGSMSPGASVGTLTFANNLVLAGTTVMELDRLAVTNADLIIASVLTYGGSLIVTNIGDPLQSGDTFNLFDWTTRSGSFTTVQLPALDPGLGWTNKLSVDGTLQVITTVSTTPTNLTFQVTGNTLEISWPSDHIGWRLEAQTNALNIGLNNNWAEVPNTTTTNKVFLPINPANGTVFFRLAF